MVGEVLCDTKSVRAKNPGSQEKQEAWSEEKGYGKNRRRRAMSSKYVERISKIIWLVKKIKNNTWTNVFDI